MRCYCIRSTYKFWMYSRGVCMGLMKFYCIRSTYELWLYSQHLRCFYCIQITYDVLIVSRAFTMFLIVFGELMKCYCIRSIYEFWLYLKHLRWLASIGIRSLWYCPGYSSCQLIGQSGHVDITWHTVGEVGGLVGGRRGWRRRTGTASEPGMIKTDISVVGTWNDQDRHFSRPNVELSRQTSQSSEPGMIKTDISVEGGGLREEENISCI